ncbi:MAG: CaiB/BaiF CoA-transferase family protein [Gammaproteobacteria bacterium]|nr:CaiB/BaiF CoA-transferase family protein [Gammaproteobacteria bacterium]
MAQAFEGIRVIDFTQVLAGPFATQQIATLGADVIKIELPGVGDQTRALTLGEDPDSKPPRGAFMSCNLGKRSITLDLKTEEAKSIVHALVATADVVVENFRPGVMASLGFDYETLAAIQQGLIYCSVSGYGQTGPKSGYPAYDGAIQADSGMMSLNGHTETGPTRTGYMPVDMATALNAAFAIAAALYRKKVTGEGQYLDVAMMDTAIVMQTPQVSSYLFNQGNLPELIGNKSPSGHPTGNVFQTTDGHIQIVALRATQVQSFFTVLGCETLLDDPAYATAKARMAIYDEVFDMVSEKLGKDTTSNWIEKLVAANVPCADIRRVDQVVLDEQFEHRKTFIDIPSRFTEGETVRLVRAGYQTNVDGPQGNAPPPRLGEHTDELLTEIGYSQPDIEALRKRGVV